MGVKKKAARTGRSFSDATVRDLCTREDWLAEAKREFLAAGIDGVKVKRLASRLRVTRGGFYWHFSSRAELLSDLLKLWEQTNTVSFERVLLNGNAGAGAKELIAIANLWLEETDFSPAFDTAVRDWARTSREAAAAVRRVDKRRIAVLHRIFQDLGFADPEALVRARIMYFHQIGYYTLNFQEERKRRRALVPIYLQILSGLPAAEIAKLMADGVENADRPGIAA